jgi:type I restriction enzyme M protein
MFVQHMVAVLKPNGIAATVMPHGVLFRGGAERDIRMGLLADDCVEAVIGLAPNLFYGTGIPACILVLRRSQRQPHRPLSRLTESWDQSPLRPIGRRTREAHSCLASLDP